LELTGLRVFSEFQQLADPTNAMAIFPQELCRTPFTVTLIRVCITKSLDYKERDGALDSLGALQASEPLISLRKQSRKQRRPHPLTCFVRDEVLANFECHMVQVPLLAMDGDRIIRCVGDAIRFVVADDKTFLTMQELHQDLGETRVAVIEHADVPESRHGLENGCEAVHGNQGHRRSGGFSSPIELGRDAIVIGLENLPNARKRVTFAQAYVSRHTRQLAQIED